MKPVVRDIRSRHSRSAGNSPLIGRVQRVRDAEGPRSIRWARQGHRRRIERQAQSGHRRLPVVLWSVVFAVASTMLIGVSVGYWLKSRGKPAQAGAPAIRPGSERVASRFASPTEDEALALVKRALANRDPAEVRRFFRPNESTPEDIVAFLEECATRDGTLERLDWLGSMDSADLLLEGVLAVYRSPEGTRERLAFLTPDDNGVWKLDFDGFARTSRPPWADLLAGKAERSLVRVFLARDYYFNGPFADESAWICYAMAAPETHGVLPEEQELLRGYCKAGSAQARALEALSAEGEAMNRATLELRRVPGAELRQFEISRVLAGEWVTGTRPYDERFQ